MNKIGEENDLNRCLRLIELQMGWGPAMHWTNYDFEKLSEQIHEKTSVRLSVTTLKRIWGKLKYESAPTLTTLNTLAVFAGYTDWRTFNGITTQDFGQVSEQQVLEKDASEKPALPEPDRRFPYVWLLFLIPLACLGYFLNSTQTKALRSPADPDLFSFSANKMVVEGVPNSVVFNYDVRASQSDSNFIVQTWDIRRKKLVPKNGKEHSAIYYYPGFFSAKLIADNQIVRTHDLWITSKGWLALAEDEPVPTYFSKEECEKENGVEVSEAILKKYNLSLFPKAPGIRIFNQRNMGDMMSDHFTFETTLKNDFSQGSNACQPVEVLIQCKDDIIIIPLSAKNCVGDLGLAFCGSYVTSKDADLSAFGTDLSNWTTLRVEVVNKQVQIYVNNKKAYSLLFPNMATGIVGVQYRFNGTGAVKDTWFANRSGTIRF